MKTTVRVSEAVYNVYSETMILTVDSFASPDGKNEDFSAPVYRSYLELPVDAVSALLKMFRPESYREVAIPAVEGIEWTL